MFEVGKLVLKIAGRDAGKVGIVLSPVKDGKILIDGLVRRKEVSIKHVVPMSKAVKIKENASSEDVKKELTKLGYESKEKYTKKFKN